MFIIYKVTNLITGKCYIGKSTDKLKNRKCQHEYDAKTCRYNSAFHKEIRIYGKENFKWEQLCECGDELLLNIRETMKIIVEHSHVSEGGYNLTWGGNGGDTFTNNPNKEEIRNRKHMNSLGELNPFYGKKHTEESRKIMPVKRCERMDQGVVEGMCGKNHTEITKQKLRESNKKQFENPYQKELRRIINKEQYKNPERLKACGNGVRGKHLYYNPITLERKMFFDDTESMGFVKIKKEVM